MKLAFASQCVRLRLGCRNASLFLGVYQSRLNLGLRPISFSARPRTRSLSRHSNTPRLTTSAVDAKAIPVVEEIKGDSTNIAAQFPAPFPRATELRSHTCGQIGVADVGITVRLTGWAHAVRDKGGVLFVLLRDRYGIVQITFGDGTPSEVVELAKDIRIEYVVDVTGVVSRRDKAVINHSMRTGEIEVLANNVAIVSKTKPMPFMVADAGKEPKKVKGKLEQKTFKNEAEPSAGEDTRLKYRYLDLRRPTLQNKLVVRHKAAMAVRNFLDASGFIEIETPILTKATPEGARDYLVPSRVHPGTWYALPQSPQIYKQLLMISGFDRYFQITRCFRDEDLRQDRQPEFTQIDLEMSFVERESVLNVAEGIVRAMFASVLNRTIGRIPRMTYKEAMDKFGLDAPDLRFGMELQDITYSETIQASTFAPITSALKSGGIVKCLVYRDAAQATSRKTLDQYTHFVKDYGLSGLLYAKVGDNGGITGPLTKVSKETGDIRKLVHETLKANAGDLVLVAAGSPVSVNTGLGKLRVKLGHESGLVKSGPKYAFCWVVDFPLLEYDEGAARYVSVHHPFTSPIKEHIPLLDDKSKLGDVISNAYDLVCNGSEIGGGSIRIHDTNVQQKVFSALGIDKEEQQEKFGFLLDALSYGAPPHGGLAFGLDRCIMVLSGANSIRDVVAFPKTTSASDLMAGAPAPVPQDSLEELQISTTAKAIIDE
ncbi:aspartyl-tRNA synthetase [Gracilaria domingensis]|nr:aspartyl-tRNA synthetase [Gracilaria domingensis]